jgi:hypothetical protein
MTLHPIPSEFPIYEENFVFFFISVSLNFSLFGIIFSTGSKIKAGRWLNYWPFFVMWPKFRQPGNTAPLAPPLLPPRTAFPYGFQAQPTRPPTTA